MLGSPKAGPERASPHDRLTTIEIRKDLVTTKASIARKGPDEFQAHARQVVDELRPASRIPEVAPGPAIEAIRHI
jgi:hypothetical protein